MNGMSKRQGGGEKTFASANSTRPAGPGFGAVVGILVFGHTGRFAFCSAATTEQFADGEAGIFGESSDLVLEFGTLALFSNAESFLDFKVQFHQVFE